MSQSPSDSEVEIGPLASPVGSVHESIVSESNEEVMKRLLDFQTRFLEDQADRDQRQEGRDNRQADLMQKLVDQQTDRDDKQTDRDRRQEDRDRRQEDREDRQAESMKALIEVQHLIVRQLVTKEGVSHQDVGTQRNLKLGEPEITSHREGAHPTTGQTDCNDYWENSLSVPPVSTANYPRVTVASLLPTSDQGRPQTTAMVNSDVRGQDEERANASNGAVDRVCSFGVRDRMGEEKEENEMTVLTDRHPGTRLEYRTVRYLDGDTTDRQELNVQPLGRQNSGQPLYRNWGGNDWTTNTRRDDGCEADNRRDGRTLATYRMEEVNGPTDEWDNRLEESYSAPRRPIPSSLIQPTYSNPPAVYGPSAHTFHQPNSKLGAQTFRPTTAFTQESLATSRNYREDPHG